LFCEDEEARFWRIDKNLPEFPPFVPRFYHRVSPWPLLFSSKTRDRLMGLVREVPALILRAARQYYEHDPAAFRARYQLPSRAYEKLSDADEQSSLLFRCDFMLVDDNPRLLEVNVGSRCGGWQVHWFWPQLAEMIRRRRLSRDWKVSHTSILEMFCRYIHRSSHAHIGDIATGNILVIIAPYFTELNFAQEAAAVYDKALAGVSSPGKLLFDEDVEGLSINSDGRVEYHGLVIDALMASSEHVTMPPELCEAHLRKLVFYPDNRLHMMVTDKTNFAVLHLARAAGWLNEHDARLVEHHVPWSAFLTTDMVRWNGAMASARDLALARREALVLKRGVSCQGKEVFVGRFLADDEWATAIERAGTSGDWIIQEYCPPDRLYAPNDDHEVTEHDAVWGMFGLGQEYGGVFARLMEPHVGCGVINAHRGAKMGLVLEV
jgi:hypothetical protein